MFKKLSALFVLVALLMVTSDLFAGYGTKTLWTKYGKSEHYVSVEGIQSNASVYAIIDVQARNYGVVIGAVTEVKCNGARLVYIDAKWVYSSKTVSGSWTEYDMISADYVTADILQMSYGPEGGWVSFTKFFGWKVYL